MYLIADIYSTFCPRHLYGSAGDQVEEIGCRKDVKVVQGKDGQRFSVRTEFLSISKPAVITKQQMPEPIKEPFAAKRKTATTKTRTLF